MPAFPASVSRPDPGRPVLVLGPNWLGDSVMAMPAVRAFRAAHPGARLALLVKPVQAEVWRLAADGPDDILLLPPGPAGVLRAAAAVRRAGFAAAYVVPRSFRAALVPFLARVPERVGLPGHARDGMLTRVVRPAGLPPRQHQAYECLDLFGLAGEALAPPRLTIPAAAMQAARQFAGAVAGPVVLAPGARRGPSKRWPAASFAEVGRRLGEVLRRPVLVVGSAAETDLCREVARLAGGALCLAGRTSLADLAAVFAISSVVIANDSGGMHLAAAAGAPVVAVFGQTDPQRTGPLGPRTAVLQESGVRCRDIPRRSAAAARSLERLRPERVFEVARELALGNNPPRNP